jgi:hypothetical protein
VAGCFCWSHHVRLLHSQTERAGRFVSEPSLSDGGNVAPRPGLRALTLPDGGLTIFAADVSTAYVMNASGAQVWHLLEGGARVPDVIRHLEAEHHSPAALALDVTRIVEDFLQAGLVVPVPADPRR